VIRRRICSLASKGGMSRLISTTFAKSSAARYFGQLFRVGSSDRRFTVLQSPRLRLQVLVMGTSRGHFHTHKLPGKLIGHKS
jgi:hypothetical protein